MSNITNCEELRNFLLSKLDDLENGVIDADKLGTISKSCETLMGTLKMQLAYSAMRNEVPNIEFLQKCNNGEVKETKIKRITHNG